MRADMLRQAGRGGMLVGTWVIVLELLMKGRDFRLFALIPAAVAAIVWTGVSYTWSAIAYDPRRPAGRRRVAAVIREANGPEPWICEVFVDDDGLRAEQCGAVVVLPWDRGFELREDRGDLVATADGQILVIRGRAFAGEDERRAFSTELLTRCHPPPAASRR